MILRDLSLQTPQENLLFDDLLLHMAEQDLGENVLRFWESPVYFIVLGRVGKAEDDIQREHVLRDKIKIFRRSSGGGTVVQGKGCLNYSLVLSKDSPDVADLRKSYAHILGKIVEALATLKVKAAFLPISDIALTDGHKKISGNAQKRGRKYILHHGTILYQFDLKKIAQYLNMPKDIPPYREARSHLDFVANTHLPVDKLKREIAAVFDVTDAVHEPLEAEQALLKEWLKTKEIEVPLNP